MEEALLKRWRLILGGNEADGTGVSLSAEESRVDAALNALYDSDRKGIEWFGSQGEPLVGRHPGVFPADGCTSDSKGRNQATELDFVTDRERDA